MSFLPFRSMPSTESWQNWSSSSLMSSVNRCSLLESEPPLRSHSMGPWRLCLCFVCVLPVLSWDGPFGAIWTRTYTTGQEDICVIPETINRNFLYLTYFTSSSDLNWPIACWRDLFCSSKTIGFFFNFFYFLKKNQCFLWNCKSPKLQIKY